ncbi:L-2-amino-thiazoline-4-carboxylic acid hydrolase [Chloroflexota bacterium]
MNSDYYLSQKSKLLKDFDREAKRMKTVLVSRYGSEFTELILMDARQEFEMFIPKVPYVGGNKNRLTRSLIGAVQCLALYRALKTHGKALEEAGRIIYEYIEESLSSLPRPMRLGLRIAWLITFTRFGKKFFRSQAEQSQKHLYPQDWVYHYVEGDGMDFNFGIDMEECCVCKLFDSLGDSELTPFVCLFDFPFSRLANSGLVRTTTLAEGGDKCDFRYKRGREVSQGWPSESFK